MECYCKSGNDFKKCCEPLLKKKSRAKSALELMRSRYSAYCTKNINYIVKTTYPKERTPSLFEDAQSWAKSVKFTNLEIVNFDENTVEFRAFYKQNENEYVHHELSFFVKENGIWYYQRGEIV